MNGHRSRYAWAFGLLAVILIALAAGVAYNIGLSQGLAQTGVEAATPPPYPYGWHRPWGAGFLFPLFFIFFWLVFFRGFCWGWGPWWHRYYGGPHYTDRLDDWHRRAHERMEGGAGPTPTPPAANLSGDARS